MVPSARIVIAVGLAVLALVRAGGARELVWTSMFSGLSAYDLDSGTHRVLLPNVGHAFGVAADSSRNTFHFTTSRGIYRFNTNGIAIETVHSTPFNEVVTGAVEQIVSPFDVAIDELTGDVYWAEGLFNPGNGVDARSIRRRDALTGEIDEVLKLNDGNYPHSFQLAPTHDLIVIAANHSGADPNGTGAGRILRSTLDGGQQQVLYELQQDGWALRGITFDLETDRVFWGERRAPRNWRVMSGTLSGSSEPTMVFDSSGLSLGGIEDLFYYPTEDKLYFGTGSAIGRLSPDGSDLEILLDDEVSSLLSFTVLDSSLALVPEPRGTLLAVLGLLGLGWIRRDATA